MNMFQPVMLGQLLLFGQVETCGTRAVGENKRKLAYAEFQTSMGRVTVQTWDADYSGPGKGQVACLAVTRIGRVFNGAQQVEGQWLPELPDLKGYAASMVANGQARANGAR
jgi:hypothetical protein